MIYICCGSPRSGSTLQYNIVCELLELKFDDVRRGYYEKMDFKLFEKINKEERKTPLVIKTHNVDPIFLKNSDTKSVNFFYSFRDLRGVISSMIKKFNISYSDLLKENFLEKYIVFFNLIQENKLKTYISQYEIFTNEIELEINRIRDVLKIQVSKKQIETISNKLSIINIRGNILSTISSDYDPKSLFHKNHIFNGQHFHFLKELDESEIILIENEYGDWLKANGYKLFFI